MDRYERERERERGGQASHGARGRQALVELDLSSNLLRAVPEALAALTGLEAVAFGGNDIDRFPTEVGARRARARARTPTHTSARIRARIRAQMSARAHTGTHAHAHARAR